MPNLPSLAKLRAMKKDQNTSALHRVMLVKAKELTTFLDKNTRKRRDVLNRNVNKCRRKTAEVQRAEKAKALKKLNADEMKNYSIIVCENYRQTAILHSCYSTLADVQLILEKLRERNAEEVIVPQNRTNIDGTPRKVEVLLIENITQDQVSSVTQVRDNLGKMIDVSPKSDQPWRILECYDWFLPETYYVYGYDPETDRKDAQFIVDMLLGSGDNVYDMRKVVIYGEKIIIDYDERNDFDIVIARTVDEANVLYESLMQHILGLGYESVAFLGHICTADATDIIDRMQAKTGWHRQRCIAKPS